MGMDITIITIMDIKNKIIMDSKKNGLKKNQKKKNQKKKNQKKYIKNMPNIQNKIN